MRVCIFKIELRLLGSNLITNAKNKIYTLIFLTFCSIQFKFYNLNICSILRLFQKSYYFSDIKNTIVQSVSSHKKCGIDFSLVIWGNSADRSLFFFLTVNIWIDLETYGFLALSTSSTK